VLEASGFEVRTADEAESMRAVLAQGFVPALVLMDIQLPGTDGLVLTRELKSNPALAGTVVAAFTAFAMPGDEERFRAAGCDAYFTKPIDVRTFAAQVRALLGAS
jgi:two-component system, cell cycle response regulator DivK